MRRREHQSSFPILQAEERWEINAYIHSAIVFIIINLCTSVDEVTFVSAGKFWNKDGPKSYFFMISLYQFVGDAVTFGLIFRLGRAKVVIRFVGDLII